jgi:hypothetical protein
VLDASGQALVYVYARETREQADIAKVLILTALAAVGCAKNPESIGPSYVSHVPYQSWNCQQLGEESARIGNALAVASEQQSNARSNDTVGVIFLGLPVSTLSGGNIAPQIARLKGEMGAVRKAVTLKGCGLG